MSARPAFTDATAFRPRTTFAGGVSPWPQVPESKAKPKAPAKTSTPKVKSPMKTAHLAANPFPAATASATAKKPGPQKGAKQQPVDVSKLKIVYDRPLPEKKRLVGKYERLFSKLKPKAAIECRPEQVNTVDQALRDWLKDKGKDKEFIVIRQQTSEEDLTKGYVWMWPAAEAHLIPFLPQNAGGRAVAEKRKAEKAQT